MKRRAQVPASAASKTRDVDSKVNQLIEFASLPPSHPRVKYETAYDKMHAGLAFEIKVRLIGRGLFEAFRKTRVQYSSSTDTRFDPAQHKEQPVSEWIARLDRYYDEYVQSADRFIIISQALQVWDDTQDIKAHSHVIFPQRGQFADQAIDIEIKKWQKRLNALPLAYRAEPIIELSSSTPSGSPQTPQPSPPSDLQALSLTTNSIGNSRRNAGEKSDAKPSSGCGCAVS